jgi:hypothetical protein
VTTLGALGVFEVDDLLASGTAEQLHRSSSRILLFVRFGLLGLVLSGGTPALVLPAHLGQQRQ